MSGWVYDLIFAAVGFGVGLTLAEINFERKRKVYAQTIETALDSVGIRRSEFNRLTREVDEVWAFLKRRGDAVAPLPE